MKQVLIVRGRAVVEDVPAPTCEAGSVLVRVDHSCISVGTELSGVEVSGQALWKLALTRPGDVKRGMEMLATKGISHTRQVVKGELEAGRPTGYSAAGVVLEVGEGVDDLRPGDRVACAGGGYANHAEVVRVPQNLVVPVPEGVSLRDASTTTLGAIALQGVRRAEPTLGETFVVIGLGVVGQLCVQLLRANGCRVVGTDLDRSRIELATSLGMDAGVHPDDGDDVEAVVRLTHGIGADGVVICAASPSDEIVSTAFRMCRKKGRTVLVGDVGLDLQRSDVYAKELDFRVSTSYGPGRYDRSYEEEGADYPVAYVRWTENRNMAAYLDLVAAGKVTVEPLVTDVHPVDDAEAAYASLEGDPRPLMVLLSYPGEQAPERTVPNPRAKPVDRDRLGVALVGAGSFAKAEHLPNLEGLGGRARLHAVMSRSGHNAAGVAKRYRARYATTDLDQVLADPDVDAALVATRHHLHAEQVLAALRAGKHVLVEKPLALDRDELRAIEAFFAGNGETMPMLLTGFNRRFSPFAERIRELTGERTNPMILTYRMNAGYLPLDHWVHGPEGGGRNVGEACHVYDLFTSLVGARVVDVDARTIRPATGHYSPRDNFVATLTFEDGSVASLTYTALGSSEHPKEQLEVFSEGRVLVLDDYRRLDVRGAGQGLSTKLPDKGHRRELEAFTDAALAGGPWPISLWEQLQAMEIAFRVEDALGSS